VVDFWIDPRTTFAAEDEVLAQRAKLDVEHGCTVRYETVAQICDGLPGTKSMKQQFKPATPLEDNTLGAFLDSNI
jgi:hypothetical protein